MTCLKCNHSDEDHSRYWGMFSKIYDFNTPSRSCSKCDCKTLIKWRVRCKKCAKILESVDRHDFVSCGCNNETFIDGGWDYLRYGGVDMKLVEILK